MKTLLFALVIFLMMPLCFAQKGRSIKIQAQNNKELDFNEVVHSLVGEGVILKNYTSNQPKSTKSIGFFDRGKKAIGIKKGIVLSSGNVEKIRGKNDVSSLTTSMDGTETYSNDIHFRNSKWLFAKIGDKGLEKTIGPGNKTFDACVMEMEIIPLGNRLSFNYVFASEEYDEYVGSRFNDGFAFYVSQVGETNSKNIAVIPGTNTPVSINNVNGGRYKKTMKNGEYIIETDKSKEPIMAVKPSNSSYYTRNNNEVYIQYDGITKVFNVEVEVVPGQPYNLKMVVADVGDNVLDSGVFIEFKSIRSYDMATNVFFDSDSYSITDDGKLVLSSIIEHLEENPDNNLLLAGHTDSVGTIEHNQELAKNRVNACYNYLVEHGVDTGNIIFSSYGESKPVTDNSDDIAKLNNRRVEIYVIPDEEPFLAEQEEKRQKLYDKLKVKKSQLYQNRPNPVDKFTKVPVYITKETKNAQLVVMDARSRVVQRIKLTEYSYYKVPLNVSNYPKGNYFLHLITDNVKRNTIKMLVQ